MQNNLMIVLKIPLIFFDKLKLSCRTFLIMFIIRNFQSILLNAFLYIFFKN